MMWKALLMHLIALLFACGAHALDYDVDWPTSDSKSHTLRITIDGCETLFKVSNKDFNTFKDNDDALHQALELALKRSRNGCKN